MNHVPIIPQTAPTWRESIPQDAPPRPRGRTGRTRVVLDSLRHWVGVGLGVACLAGGYMGWRAWNENPAALAAPVPATPLREIVVRGDGVLDRAWVERTLRIPVGAGLMDLDLEALREKLLRGGQVRQAVITRRMPDVLVVTLEERSPVLRLRARDDEGRDNLLFVARDGFVFSGEGYDRPLMDSLPWLAGVRLTRDREGLGFTPVHGMEIVSELLGTVRVSAPALSRQFQIVSLARYAADGVILVRTPEVAEIAFGLGEGFYPQIARLDYILDELRARGDGIAAPVRSINLAVGGRQVPVAFALADESEPTVSPTPAPAPRVEPAAAPRSSPPAPATAPASAGRVAPTRPTGGTITTTPAATASPAAMDTASTSPQPQAFFRL